MRIFAWDRRYETGIESIDRQHRQLIEWVNALGEALLAEDAARIDQVFQALQEYAQVHFADEERLMVEQRLPAAYIDRHRESHRTFVHELARMHPAGTTAMAKELTEGLHDFLSAWLVYHILGEDRLIPELIAAGDDPAARAAIMAPQPATDGAEVLLTAVRNLYRALSQSNRELEAANSRLEAKVTARTRALSESNARLLAEQERLRQALQQVQTMQAQLRQSEKLASVGQLAAGVAHEINNPVGFVGSNLTSLGEYVEDLFALIDAYTAAEPLIARDPQRLDAIRRLWRQHDIEFARGDLANLLRDSREGLRRIKCIVQDLQELSHKAQPQWQLADLHQGLDSTLDLIAPKLRGRIEVHRDYGELPPLRCNPGQLNQVFLNLLINAIHAIDGPGRIVVRSGRDDAGGFGWIDIEDDGRGIAAEELPHIFEPFFTTKPVDQGNGLGLSVCWGIVQQHGGGIEAVSEPGSGTRFRVRLPLSEPGDPRPQP